MLQIREATPADADAIGELTEQAYRSDGYIGGAGSEGYAAVLRDGSSRVRDAGVLVAEIDDAIVGTVTVAAAGTPYAEIAAGGELEVRMLAVSPTARRRGVALALMAEVTARAGKAGLDRIVLLTGRNMVPAQRLYEQLGFRRVPDRDWDVGYPLLAYGRDID